MQQQLSALYQPVQTAFHPQQSRSQLIQPLSVNMPPLTHRLSVPAAPFGPYGQPAFNLPFASFGQSLAISPSSMTSARSPGTVVQPLNYLIALILHHFNTRFSLSFKTKTY